jgi:hypothetical protein
VVGYRLVDTIETAALEAIHIFCNQHPMKVAGHPIGLFPVIDSSDPEWNFRIAHYGHMLGDSTEETLCGTIHECPAPLSDPATPRYGSVDWYSSRSLSKC